MAEIQSLPYRPDPAQCCEACAFASGKHALWCREGKVASMHKDGLHGLNHPDDFLAQVSARAAHSDG